MRIIFYECKKALTSPILLSLFVLFTVYNAFLIYSHSYNKEELAVANELAKRYGILITDESLEQLEIELQQDLTMIHEITRKHTDREFTSIGEFFDYLYMDGHDKYTEEELTLFHHLLVKEMYYTYATTIDDSYTELDWRKIADSKIKSLSLSGDAAMMLRGEYEKLSERFEEMIRNEEHKSWFFAGKPYRMHSLLFRKIFVNVIIESILLIVLATALITNFEFEQKTHLVTYCTKRGKRLINDKLIASLITTTVITAILFTSTLAIYFSIFDYSSFWSSPISSAFNWEYQLPYVSWWNISFFTFLLLSISLIYICSLLFSAIAFIISIFLKNSYVTFVLFAIFFIASLLIVTFMPTSSFLIFVAVYTLPTLVINPHMFFMGNSKLTMFKYYELMTVSAWIIIVSLLCVLSLKTFYKQDIH